MKAKHTGNDAFKTYLNYIITNATKMLEDIGNQNIAPADKAQDQKPAEITSKLPSLNSSTSVLSEEP